MTGPRQELTVRYLDGDRTCPGLPTPAPGLWAVQEAPAVYHLVHVATGCSVATHFPSPEAALAAAERMAEFADWTKPTAEIQRDLARIPRGAREAMLGEYGARLPYPATAAQLEAWEGCQHPGSMS